MLVTKKESRYNAYMKRTDSGIIVKTVDSVTGVESLIKFTSDKILLPGEPFGTHPPKEINRPVVKKSSEGNPYVNKKKKYYLSKRNPKIITKLSNPRPYSKEIQPNIPGFNVYEDRSSSTLDFQNSKVIFVANSKLAKDGVVNLSIPGNLANVCYHGALNENGFVKFKAKSVIKPFTIIIGDYVINVNICHNLTSVTDTRNPNQLKDKDSSILSSYSKGNGKPFNKEKCSDIRETEVESKTNETKFDTFNEDCRIKMDDETAVISDSVYGELQRRISNENVESAPHFDNCEREKMSELLTKDLELNPTQTENVAAGEILNKSSSEENNQTEEINTKPSPSVDSSLNKFTSLSNQSSENVIERKGLHPDTCNSHIPQNVKSCERCKTSGNNSTIRNCLSSVTNSYALPDDLKRSKLNKFSSNSVVGGFDTNNLPVHRNLETEPLLEFDNGHTVEENNDKRPNSRCSNSSMLEIKKKLSEATTSLHKICSVIESIDNFSGKTVSEETVGSHHFEVSCESLNKIIQGRLNKANSNSSTIVIKSRSDESHPRNVSNMNKNYSEGANRLKKKNYVYQACGECEKLIQATSGEIEIEDSLSAKYRTSDIMEPLNGGTDSLCLRDTFGEINYVRSLRKKIEQNNILIQATSGEIEIEDSLSAKYRTSDIMEPLNGGTDSLCLRDTFGEINYVRSLSKKIEQNNTMEKAGNKIPFDGKRQVQSLTNLSESNIPCVDNLYETGRTSNSVSINQQTKTIPNVLSTTKYLNNLQTGEPQGGKIGREFPGKIKRSSMTIEDRIWLPEPKTYINDNLSTLSAERSYTTCLRYNQELGGGTSSGQERQTSDPKINSYSTNSIRTIYIKSECNSSNNLTMPVQHSSMQISIDDKDTNQVQNNDASLTNIKTSCKEKVSKSNFGQKIKQKLSKLKTHWWNFGTVSNRKESDLTLLSENSKNNGLGIDSDTKNLTAANEENGVYFSGKPESLIDLNDDDVRENTHHEKRDGKTFPDLKFTPCKNCSQILSDIGIKAPYTTISDQNRINLGLLRNREKLYENCIKDPTDVFSQYSDVSFKR